jgi:hypothetical protein
MKYVVVLSSIVLVFLNVITPIAFADTQSGGSGNSPGIDSGASGNAPSTVLINPLKGINCNQGTSNSNCLSSFLISILKIVIEIGSIVVVLMIVYTGFKFVVARGNASELEEARRMLLWTLIGALILLGAQAIAMGIQATVQALGG